MNYHSSILVDSHVHFHRCCDAPGFLTATLSNFYRTAGPRSDGGSSVAVLAVVDGQNEDGFERLVATGANLPAPDAADTDRWISRSTDEQISTGFEQDGKHVVIIQGRQIRTRERLEVLAIGTDARVDDGQSIQSVIRQVNDVGAIAVVPWGFGKWFGARAKVMRQLLDDFGPDSFFLGDNANRPAIGPRPRLFADAEARGFRVLPGSDPLPFPAECRRAGRAGFALSGDLDLNRPAEDLKQKLIDHTNSIRTFGELENPIRFVRNQFRMQRAKHSTTTTSS